MTDIENLNQRIDAMDWKKPYVWRLRISSSEFKALETAVSAGEATAKQNVVYLAEWYKRCYEGAEIKPVREFDAKTLFEEAEIDKANLFATESGNNTWLYSIYVLGGVAMKFECAKTDTKFLRELCKIYYGEDRDVDSLDVKDKSRAVAFRESIRTRGCLYEYLATILEGLKSGNLPFDPGDLTNDNSLVNSFLRRLKSANDAVLKAKFDIEFVVRFDPYATYMTRKLRLVLKPESLGGLNHQYLGYERVRQWEVKPETCKSLVVGVRFLMDGSVVAEPDFNRPLLVFSNTGSPDAGFVAWGTERHSRQIDVPTDKFNAAGIVVQDEYGGCHEIETFPVAAWMQVFRVPEGYNEWTTQLAPQRDSAVICPSSFVMQDVQPDETIYLKKFGANGCFTCDPYQWRYVVGSVRFIDGTGKSVTVYDRRGYDRVITRLHDDVLRYRDGGIAYYEEQDGELVESRIPIAFAKEDVLVMHSDSKVADGAPSGLHYAGVDKVEFKKEVHFHEWTDADSPQGGKVTLRATVKGVQRPPMTIFYLPGGVCRDCENNVIFVGDESVKDTVVRDGVPLDPVYSKSIDDNDAYACLEIWRPVNHREFVRDGKVVEYVDGGSDAEISFMQKDGLLVRDFSADGFREYDCSGIKNVFDEDAYTDGSYAAITNQHRERVCEKFDELAPEWLWINLTKKIPLAFGMHMFYWDYLASTDPKEVDENFACKGNDIVFQSLKGFAGCCVMTPRVGTTSPFTYARVKAKIDIVKCFEVATEHRVYYSAFYPLRNLNAEQIAELEKQLIARRGGIGKLTDADIHGLRRLKSEHGFSEKTE